MPGGPDDELMLTGCRSRDKSGCEAIEESGKSRGGLNDQSGRSIDGDMLVRDSSEVDGSGARKLADKGDGLVGDGIGFPGADRGTVPKPACEGGEELKGMFKIGVLRDGKEAGIPLSACTKSTSSRAVGLDNGSGAVGGVKPVFPGGLDKERAESRLPPGIPVVLGGEVWLDVEAIEGEDLLSRETFEVLRMTGHD